MNLYHCIVRHRNGYANDCIYIKELWIEADTGLAAYIKAKELTRDMDNQVYDPDIKLYIPPRPDYTCTTEQVIREYGTLAYEKADEDTRFASWRDDPNGKKRYIRKGER